MLQTAKDYNTNLSAIRITPHILAQLPAWYHLSAERRSLNNSRAKCLLRKHNVATVADLVQTSAHLRHPLQHPTHRRDPNCNCNACLRDKALGCINPNGCATEALTRLNLIPPKHNPTKQDPPDGLSLTKSGKSRNHSARQNNEEVTFDATMTCKENLAECFRIFTNPKVITHQVAQRHRRQGPIPRCNEIIVYTDGACLNNGKENARCGSGIWFGHNDPRNKSIRIPDESQSNQVGEIAAIIVAVDAVSPYQPLKIVTDSKYVIKGLTAHLEKWEDDGWIGIKNAKFFKKAAFLLRRRRAKTKFLWTKGHNGTEGNEESNKLAKQGANKTETDVLNLEIPVEFETQGAKLATLTQAKAYQGIMEKKEADQRRAAKINLQLTREAIHQATGELETDSAIWYSIRKPVFSILVQQFLYRTIHNTHMTGKYWRNIRNCGEREICATCNTTDSMSHILTQCRANDTQTTWTLARNFWPYDNIPWPDLNIGTILGCGAITLKAEGQRRINQQTTRRKTLPGPTRLLQIIISESAYLIWVLRCERVVQGLHHTEREIESRWLRKINERLTTDRITATRIKRTNSFQPGGGDLGTSP